MIDGMISRIKEELSEDAVVVATGGYAPVVLDHCKEKIVYDADLILKGLARIYKKNK